MSVLLLDRTRASLDGDINLLRLERDAAQPIDRSELAVADLVAAPDLVHGRADPAVSSRAQDVSEEARNGVQHADIVLEPSDYLGVAGEEPSQLMGVADAVPQDLHQLHGLVVQLVAAHAGALDAELDQRVGRAGIGLLEGVS